MLGQTASCSIESLISQRKKRSYSFLLVLILFVSCSPSEPDVTTERWSYDSHQPLPQLLSHPSFQQTSRQVLVGDHLVTYGEQKVGMAYIKNGNIFKVQEIGPDKLKEVRIQNALGAQSEIEKIENKARDLYVDRGRFYQKIKTKYSLFRNIKLMDEIRVLFQENGKKGTFFYGIRFIPASNDQVLECEVTLSLEIRSCYPLSFHFQAPAWIFTLQSLNQIEEVLLTSLKEPSQGQLVSSTHKVTSESPLSIKKEDLPFRYDTDDPRFDQVQSFYWVDKALQFAQSQFQIHLPVSIEVKTYVGYPKNINANFTFQNNIHLGRGDGLSYKNIAQDPSIITHEVAHVLIDNLAHLPSQGEGGSINEGFADYFAATLLSSPLMGSRSYLKAPYRRNLDEKVSYLSQSGKIYQDSLIISSALWEIEKKLGPEKSRRLFLKTLLTLGPANAINELALVLKKIIPSELDEKDQLEILTLLKDRDWPL